MPKLLLFLAAVLLVLAGQPRMKYSDTYRTVEATPEGFEGLPEALALLRGHRAMADARAAEHDWAAAPMLDLVLHINRESIHHLAEAALLRDLWANGAR